MMNLFLVVFETFQVQMMMNDQVRFYIQRDGELMKRFGLGNGSGSHLFYLSVCFCLENFRIWSWAYL